MSLQLAHLKIKPKRVSSRNAPTRNTGTRKSNYIVEDSYDEEAMISTRVSIALETHNMSMKEKLKGKQ